MIVEAGFILFGLALIAIGVRDYLRGYTLRHTRVQERREESPFWFYVTISVTIFVGVYFILTGLRVLG